MLSIWEGRLDEAEQKAGKNRLDSEIAEMTTKPDQKLSRRALFGLGASAVASEDGA
jgi:hypothetical protein